MRYAATNASYCMPAPNSPAKTISRTSPVTLLKETAKLAMPALRTTWAWVEAASGTVPKCKLRRPLLTVIQGTFVQLLGSISPLGTMTPRSTAGSCTIALAERSGRMRRVLVLDEDPCGKVPDVTVCSARRQEQRVAGLAGPARAECRA